MTPCIKTQNITGDLLKHSTVSEIYLGRTSILFIDVHTSITKDAPLL